MGRIGLTGLSPAPGWEALRPSKSRAGPLERLSASSCPRPPGRGAGRRRASRRHEALSRCPPFWQAIFCRNEVFSFMGSPTRFVTAALRPPPGPVGDPVGSARHLRILWLCVGGSARDRVVCTSPPCTRRLRVHTTLCVGSVSESKFEGRRLGRLSFEPAR